ncbi:MAG: HmuY family protein [Bacteroidetes bacterium]|nr:HmuY family protein [Bacteroidota bacterium]
MIRLAHLFITVLTLGLTACWPAEEPITLPSLGGDGTGPSPVIASVEMGSAYDYRIYVSLTTGAQYRVHNNLFDIAIGTAELGYPVYMNEGKLVRGYRTNSYTFEQVYATPNTLIWTPDAPSQNPDSTLVGNWQLLADTEGKSPVYLIDRGSLYHTGSSRYYKLQLLGITDGLVRLRYAPAAQTTLPEEMQVPLSSTHALTYVSFESTSPVAVAPPDDDWDLLFTRHFQVYLDQPLDSPTRNYSVTGILGHRFKGVQAALLTNAADLGTMDKALWEQVPPQSAANAIGFDWKVFSFDANNYLIRPHRVYGVWLPDGKRFGLQFLDFFDEQGQKGTPTFVYQQIP